ncbi:MAG: hypothetical protein ACRDRL_30200, partial [Sciscionella sp.]
VMSFALPCEADVVPVLVAVEAPPVAAEVAAPVAVPPLPVAELAFEPAPPAPPIAAIATMLYAELDCVRSLTCVLVLLPELDADAPFDCEVAPCVDDGSFELLPPGSP